tara:strand:+ start:48405 stop:49307 length:903 start_codon:yes stop_codon:yes gene_type:complete
MNKKVLITGSNGLLGQHLVRDFSNNCTALLATSFGKNRLEDEVENYRSLDVSDYSAVLNVIEEFQPDVIINAAAATDVDKCEDEPQFCDAINHLGVRNIVKAVKKLKINTHLIHISTDFIFDGEKMEYDEEDAPDPLSEYGKSKLLGENALKDAHYSNFTIVRTSLVYGVGKALNKGNIFLWAMEKLRNGDELTIVNDQFRSPTYVNDLSKACFDIANSYLTGIINIAGKETLSMYEYICQVAEYIGKDRSLVQPITSEVLNQKAHRPKGSGLSINKAREKLLYKPTEFKDSLRQMDAKS